MATTSESVRSRETTTLIGSDKVEGTAVYGADQQRIGSIERLMIDKISGKVAYAVISFGRSTSIEAGAALPARGFSVGVVMGPVCPQRQT